MLSDYKNIRAHLFNSQALLEGTNLVLFTINEATLIRWYKNSTRISEIKTLMQGIPLSLPPPCATEPFSPAVERPTEPPPPPQDPHLFPEPEDTTGKAVIGRRRSVVVATPIAAPPTPSARASAASTSASTSTSGVGMSTSSTSMSPSASADLSSLGGEVMVQDEPEVSRTTKWRQLKRTGSTAPPGRLRRAYMCKVCKRPETSKGHTRFQGHRYCPYSPGRYQRMSGWPSKEKRPRPRRHWPKRQQQHQRAVDRCSLVLLVLHILICLLYIYLLFIVLFYVVI